MPSDRNQSLNSAHQSILVTGDGNSIHFVINGDRGKNPAADAALLGYYRGLAEQCNRLPLAIVDPKLGDHPDHLTLERLYTELHVTAPERAEGDDERRFGLRLAQGEGTRRSLLEAAAEEGNWRMVLVGDAGSGKSTFVNYLARRLVLALGESAAGASDPDWSPALGPDAETAASRRGLQGLSGLLPIRLVLREVRLDGAGRAGAIWGALREELGRALDPQGAAALFPPLQQALMGQGLFLLDGLDEVPETDDRRAKLIDAVNELAGSLGNRARILVTARPYAYAKEPGPLRGFTRWAVAPLDGEAMDGFVDHWYQTLKAQMQWSAKEAEGRAADLKFELNRRSYLADLASRPLLLTLIASLHASHAKLPQDRAEVYEQSVELLLHRWQRRYGPDCLDPHLARALLLDDEKLRDGVERLAFEMHQRQGGSDGRSDYPADIPAAEAYGLFAPLLPKDFNPTVALEFLDTRSGLLQGRGEGLYGFLHRSFQEYLAACHLVKTCEDPAESLLELLRADLAWWREVWLLAVGQNRRTPASAFALVESLLDEDGEPEASLGNLLLAAEGGLDLRLDEGSANRRAQKLVERLQRELVAALPDADLPLRDRALAGDLLGRLGDPRDGVGLKEGLPDIEWIDIPAREFIMGSDSDYEQEKPAHRLALPAFRIARFPITNAQFRPFVEAGGYEEERYWSTEGWAWRNGAKADLSGLDSNKDLQKQYADWLAKRPKERRCEPFFWRESPHNNPSRPVIGISWHEANAFCNWLSERQGLTAGTIRLPTEAEWERAIRGADGRRWPWGNEWLEGKANTKEAGLEQTSAVGLFSGGASPEGVEEGIGNVWEWTSSRWGRDLFKSNFGYPYDPADGRESPEGADFRIIRGGSWYDEQKYARCSCRYGYIPDSYYGNLGFRVVFSLAAC